MSQQQGMPTPALESSTQPIEQAQQKQLPAAQNFEKSGTFAKPEVEIMIGSNYDMSGKLIMPFNKFEGCKLIPVNTLHHRAGELNVSANKYIKFNIQICVPPSNLAMRKEIVRCVTNYLTAEAQVMGDESTLLFHVNRHDGHVDYVGKGDRQESASRDSGRDIEVEETEVEQKKEIENEDDCYDDDDIWKDSLSEEFQLEHKYAHTGIQTKLNEKATNVEVSPTIADTSSIHGVHSLHCIYKAESIHDLDSISDAEDMEAQTSITLGAYLRSTEKSVEELIAIASRKWSYRLKPKNTKGKGSDSTSNICEGHLNEEIQSEEKCVYILFETESHTTVPIPIPIPTIENGETMVDVQVDVEEYTCTTHQTNLCDCSLRYILQSSDHGSN